MLDKIIEFTFILAAVTTWNLTETLFLLIIVNIVTSRIFEVTYDKFKVLWIIIRKILTEMIQ
jgi:hypothetical protein